jgi:hypothetical protein
MATQAFDSGYGGGDAATGDPKPSIGPQKSQLCAPYSDPNWSLEWRVDGISELCRCGCCPRRGGGCTFGEPRNKCSRAIRHGALLGRQEAVIRGREELGHAHHALPLAGGGRRRISAAIVAPTLPCIVHLSRRAAGSVERSDRGAAMWPGTLVRRVRPQCIPPSPNHQMPAERCTILPLPAPSLRTPIRLPAKCRKITRHSTSLRSLTI